MAIRVKDNGLSPRISADPKNPSVEADFVVSGLTESHTLDDVMVAVIAFAPVQVVFRLPKYAESVISTLFTRLYQVGVKDQKFIGPGIATATVIWGQSDAAPAPSKGGPDPNHGGDGPPEGEELGPEWKFQTNGGTKHITQSLKTKARKLYTGADAPDMRNIIGWSKDRIEGCDIGIGDLSWSYTAKGCELQWQKRRYYTEMTYSVNSDKFCGVEPGELLFTGVTADYTPGNGWTMTWSFSERPNESINIYPPADANEPGDPFSVAKGGHDFAWYAYTDTVVGSGVNLFTVAKADRIYVEQVFPEKPFKELFKV